MPGDVVLSHNATIGRVAILPEYHGRILLGTSLTYFRVNPARLSARYLAAFLMGRDFQKQLEAVMSHTTRNQVPITAQRKLRIVLPPLPEQRAIAAILGALDDKIELNRRMNETLEEMARTIFKSWFVDFDPVRAKVEGRQLAGMDADTAALFPSRFVESELGEIPEGWDVKTVEAIQDGPRGTAAGPFGSNLTRKHYTENGVPVIRGQNMNGSGPYFRDDDFVYVSEEKADDLAGNLARPGDVLFTQRGTLGQVALIPESPAFPRYVLSQSQMRLTTALVPPLFVYLHFSDQRTIDFILANATAAGVPHINLGFLRGLKLCVPTREVSAAFRDVAEPLMRRLVANSRESRTLAELRDTLLPKLISGELRVPDAEKLVEEVAS